MSSTSMPPEGSTSAAPKASLVGEVLDGRYRIVKMLGEGGMGEVYAAEHVHIDKRFAVKLLRPEIVSNPEAVSRFRQEARSASSIGHRNIIGIEDFGQLPDGRIYMCMELLQGAPLNDLIQQPMAADRLLNIMIQTGHGLAAAHSKGIVHRDMKPENIYVTVGPNHEDIPKLLDFGIAKVAGNDGQNNLTRTGTIFGTPFYMAPEQALGQGVDARADIYAMGVIMYEVFSGSLPFQGESFMGILTQHITSDPEPVVQRAAKAGRQLPPGMAEIISRCMQKDPQRRFATMDELVAALVEVYRAISGAGMSTYMAAFPVQPSGAHASQPSMPGTPQRSIPTMMAGSMAAPGSQPVPAYVPQASATAPAVPGALRDSGASSYAAAPAASVGMAASDSLSVPARGSKAPLIILLTLLLLGGGGAAYYFLVYAKKATPTTVAGAGSGSAIVDAGSGSAVLAAGSGSAIVNAGSGSAVLAAGSGSGSGSGSAVALVVDAGLPPPDAAPAVAVIDAPSAPAVQVSVLVKANAPRAKFFDGTRQVGDRGSAMVKVTPGVPLVLRVEASDYKDATVTVDGSTDQLDVKLEKKATTSSGGNGSGSGTVVRPPDPDPPKTECADKWKDKTKACKKAFCEANPGNLKCLE